MVTGLPAEHLRLNERRCHPACPGRSSSSTERAQGLPRLMRCCTVRCRRWRNNIQPCRSACWTPWIIIRIRARRCTNPAAVGRALLRRRLLRRIAGLSAALAELGIGPGDRVAIFAPNCPEWHVADFAIAGLGAITVPIYFRESPEHIEYIVGHSAAKAVFVAGEEQCARLGQVRPRLASCAST